MVGVAASEGVAVGAQQGALPAQAVHASQWLGWAFRKAWPLARRGESSRSSCRGAACISMPFARPTTRVYCSAALTPSGPPICSAQAKMS